jgi:hypothetical protein
MRDLLATMYLNGISWYELNDTELDDWVQLCMAAGIENRTDAVELRATFIGLVFELHAARRKAGQKYNDRREQAATGGQSEAAPDINEQRS